MADRALSGSAVALVLTSATLHAGWNLLLKRAGGSQIVVAYSKAAEMLLFLPLFLLGFLNGLPAPGRVLLFVTVAAAGVLANYMALAAAYRRADLGVVYPVSRGAALVFLPILGALFLGERLGLRALGGLVLIVGGILVLQLSDLSSAAVTKAARELRRPAMGFAVFAAFLTATYTVWDKAAVREMHPFAYMYLYTVFVAAAYLVWAQRRVPAEERRAAWSGHKWPIVGIGVMNMGSYYLTLVALQTDVSSLVIGLRQLSIVVGVLLGWRVLGEQMTRPRMLGVSLIASGCLVVASR